jgi:hypothetical protein
VVSGFSRTFLQPVDGRDVGVIERRQRLRFAGEPSKPVGITGEGLGQDLQRDVAIELRVAGTVHLAHPAGAEGGENLVRAEARTRGQKHGAG